MLVRTTTTLAAIPLADATDYMKYGAYALAALLIYNAFKKR